MELRTVYSPGGELEVGEEETDGMKRLLDLTLGRTDGVRSEWKIEVPLHSFNQF